MLSEQMKSGTGNRMDLFLFFFAIFVYFTTDWRNITTLQWMVLVLYAICLIVRMANILKNRK